ncbi:hypothetical protein [Kitasatospora sp. NPDC059673]|uniref:hypothetical protein n=1 Tax=Kitasatospora sp. NPDC059673 TaxID=3346901 RepID=UPI0036BB6B3F
MTKTRPSVRRDVLHALWLTALEVPLLCAVPYAFVLMVFALAAASERGGGAGGAVALCVLVMALAVAVPLTGLVVTLRRGYRITPVALVMAGPALAAIAFSVAGG